MYTVVSDGHAWWVHSFLSRPIIFHPDNINLHFSPEPDNRVQTNKIGIGFPSSCERKNLYIQFIQVFSCIILLLFSRHVHKVIKWLPIHQLNGEGLKFFILFVAKYSVTIVMNTFLQVITDLLWFYCSAKDFVLFICSDCKVPQVWWSRWCDIKALVWFVYRFKPFFSGNAQLFDRIIRNEMVINQIRSSIPIP